MSILRARRPAAVTGVLAALAFAAPGPVQAAPADEVELEVTDVLVPAGRTSAGVAVRLTNSGDENVLLRKVTVVVDASGLTGVATVTEANASTGGRCATQDAITTCTYETLSVPFNGAEDRAEPVRLTLAVTEGATAGTSGTYAVTAEADGFSGTGRGKVTVTEAVGLVAGPDIKLSGAPGSTLSLTPEVRNVGTKVVRGAVLRSSSGPRIASYPRQYSNCVYTATEFACVFDQELAAGKQYAPAAPMAIRLGQDALAPSTFGKDVYWATGDGAVDFVRAMRANGGEPGTGPVLRLAEKPQTIGPDRDNFTTVVVEVTGSNLPDLAATGATVRGTAGETVTTKIGIKNLGPAVIDTENNHYPGAQVVIPAGTTVVNADLHCRPEGKAGEFYCFSGGLGVGETATWEFDLKIGATGTGRVTARIEIDGSDDLGPDRNAANNAAELRINPPASPSPTSASPSPSSSPTAVPGLPITGTNATPTVAVGVALLLAGVALVAATRRRESHDAA